MKPIEFKEANKTFAECAPLPTYVSNSECISCWELSDEDLIRIAANKKIWLRVSSGNKSQPPVILQAEDPFTEICENCGCEIVDGSYCTGALQEEG